MEFNTSDLFSKLTISGISDRSNQQRESETAHANMFADTSFAQGDQRDIPERNKQESSSASIENEGAIASARVSNGWERGESESNIKGRMESFHPREEESALLALHEPAREVNATAAGAFHNLLFRHRRGTHGLSSEEIKAIEPVMNMFNLGDNQFTNPAHPGDRYAPVFHVDACQVKQVNNKPVLEVEGNFVNRGGEPTTRFRGIIIDRDNTGRRAQGITFEAPDASLYRRYVSAFDAMLKSIRWAEQ